MNPGDVRDWLEQAHGDLRYAKLGRADRTILLNLVGFHAQQAVAKAIKALLVKHRLDFPKTHDSQQFPVC